MSSEVHDHWSLAQVVTLLQHEFPEVTISKIRFMESQGLIAPQRTASGYRHFFQGDYERLHWILVQQRDSYLPLRVIRDRLNGGERLPAVTAPDVTFAEPEPDPEPEAQSEPEEAPASQAMEHEGTHRVAQARPDAHAVPEALRAQKVRNERIDWAAELDTPLTSGAPGVGAGAGRAAPPLSDRSPDPDSRRHGESSPPAEDAESPDRPSELSNGAVSAAQPLYTRLTPVEGTQASLGLDLPEPDAAEPEPPRLPGMSLSMKASELARSAGVKPEFVTELTRFGVIAPTSEAGSLQYANDAIEIVKLAADFAEFGLEPRHMRTILLSAEREVELYTQTVGAGLLAGNADTRREAHRNLGELATKAASMRAVMIKRMLRTLTP